MKQFLAITSFFVPQNLILSKYIRFLIAVYLWLLILSFLILSGLVIYGWIGNPIGDGQFFWGVLDIGVFFALIYKLKDYILLYGERRLPYIDFSIERDHFIFQKILLQHISVFTLGTLIPLLLASGIWGNGVQHIYMWTCEALLMINIYLIWKDKIVYAHLISIFVIYSLISLVPATFGDAQGSIPIIMTIFIGVAFTLTERKIHILNLIGAIAATFAYSYVNQHFAIPLGDSTLLSNKNFLVMPQYLVLPTLLLYYHQQVKNYREDLENSNQFFQKISNLNPHLIFVKDKHRRFVFVNDAYAATHQLPKKEIIGKRGEEFYPDPKKNTQFQDSDKEVLQKGISKFIPSEKLYLRSHLKWLDTVKTPLLDVDNQIIGLLGVSTDITQHILAEKAISEQEQEYQRIVNSSPIGIVTDIGGQFLHVNPAFCKITGYTQSELLEGGLWKILSPKSIQNAKKIVDLIQSGEVKQFQTEGELIRKNGSICQIMLNTRGVYDEEGNYIKTLNMIADITEMKQQQEIIEQQMNSLNVKNEELQKYIDSNMQLENFAYLASHDLKAPIRTMVSFTQLLAKSAISKLTQDEKEYMEFIVSASRNMQQLVENLLNYSRINTVKQVLTKVDVRKLLKSILAETDSYLKEKKAQIELGNLPETIIADPTQIRQLFQNLIMNGIKFQKKGQKPHIFISGMEHKNEWSFSVKDNGIGIAPKFHHKIFRLFRKLNRPDLYEGSGIGLALCSNIVEQHGGIITVDSQQGEGAKFHFTIKKNLDTSLPKEKAPKDLEIK